MFPVNNKTKLSSHLQTLGPKVLDHDDKKADNGKKFLTCT